MRSRSIAILSLVAIVLIWGSTFVATKVLLEQMGPLTLAFVRFVIASIILIPLADWRGARALPWGRLAILGLTGVALYFACQNVGLVYTSASAATLILAGIPAFVAIGAAVTLGERVTWSRGLGIAASVAGVALVVLVGKPQPTATAPLLGDLIILASALAWTVYTLVGKGLERLPHQQLSAASVGFGAVFLGPPAAFEALSRPQGPVSVAGWLGIVYLAAAASALAFWIWNYALRQLDATEASIYLNLIPIVGVSLAVFVLRESVSLPELVGGALVIVGVVAATWAPRKRHQVADSAEDIVTAGAGAKSD